MTPPRPLRRGRALSPGIPLIAALLATVLGAGTLIGPVAPAAAAGTPRTFTLIGRHAELGLVDNGTPGASLGDIRTLGLRLFRTDGRRVGHADVVQTLTYEGAVDRALKVAVLTLPQGTISAMGTTTFPDFLDPAARPDDRAEHIAIVGGTGIYRGATGFIDIVVRPRFVSAWIIHLG